MITLQPSSARESPSPEQEAFFRRYVDAAKHTGHRAWDLANQLTNSYVAFLAQAIRNFVAKGMQESAMFAYWAMFSLFPLVMLGIVAATFLFGESTAKTQIYAQLNNVIPGGTSAIVRSNLDQAFAHRDGFGLFAILGLVYGSFGLFTALQRNLSRIFRDEKRRSLPMQLLTDLVMIAMLGVLVGISILATIAFTGTSSEYRQLLIKRTPWYAVGAVVLPVIVNSLIFGLLFRYIPRRKISWRALIPSAILAGVAWELCKAAFGWYLQNFANFGILYGSLGTVMALLAWTYLTGAFISLWGELAVATDDWLSRRPPSVAISASPVNKPIHKLTPQEFELSSAPDAVPPNAPESDTVQPDKVQSNEMQSGKEQSEPVQPDIVNSDRVPPDEHDQLGPGPTVL